MVEDVTERIMTEQVRQDFVTNAGHELRTPLSLIHGYIETLKGGLIKNPGALQRCLNVMEKHSRRMMRIIEDMLTISRLEGRDEPLKMETFLLRGCVDNALEHLLLLIETHQPVITLNFPPDGGLLHGDRFYWDQILTNLIENALKENQRPGLRLTITGRWSAHECILTIEDDGVGIRAEDVPFVFKRFYRCAKDHSQEVKGTGLGLSIVKRAVEAHGGSIELESRPKVRTVFTIRVPLPE
jgi:signal transduction histidine kinase